MYWYSQVSVLVKGVVCLDLQLAQAGRGHGSIIDRGLILITPGGPERRRERLREERRGERDRGERREERRERQGRGEKRRERRRETERREEERGEERDRQKRREKREERRGEKRRDIEGERTLRGARYREERQCTHAALTDTQAAAVPWLTCRSPRLGCSHTAGNPSPLSCLGRS